MVLPSWQQSLRDRKMSTSNGEKKIELMHATSFKLFRPMTDNAINNSDFSKKFAFSDRSGHNCYALQTPINIATSLSAATTRDMLKLG